MMQINIRELFDTLLQSADLPLLTAFVLGLLVALNPCQLAISVSALAYEYRNGKRLIDGLVYALGRTITYTAMGWVTMCLIGGGANVVGLQQVLSKADTRLTDHKGLLYLLQQSFFCEGKVVCSLFFCYSFWKR